MTNQFTLAKSVLKNIFGLSDDTIDKIFTTLKTNGHLSSVKDQTINRRLSGLGMEYLKNSISHVKDSRNIKKEESDDDKKEKHAHIPVKETINFSSYLINELNIEVSGKESPDMIAQKTQNLKTMAKKSPEQLQQIAVQQARERNAQVATEKDPRKKALLAQKNRLMDQLDIVNKQLSQLK